MWRALERDFGQVGVELGLVSKSAGKNFFPAIWFFFAFKKAFDWLPLLEMIETVVIYHKGPENLDRLVIVSQ